MNDKLFIDRDLLSIYDQILKHAESLDKAITKLGRVKPENPYVEETEIKITFNMFGSEKYQVCWDSDTPSIQSVPEDNAL